MAVSVKYVGKKEGGTHDSEAGSNTVWKEPGDVQNVPDRVWEKLQRFPDVWERVPDSDLSLASTLAPASPVPALAPEADATVDAAGEGAPANAGPKFVIDVGGQSVVLDALEREALHALAKDLEVKVHHSAGVDKVRQALLEAHPVPAGA